VEAAYLLLFEDVGQDLSLLQRDLKMLFSGFPLARRNYRDTRNGPCEKARAGGSKEVTFHGTLSGASLSGTTDMTSRGLFGTVTNTGPLSLTKQ
jgi:hypothetical protein